MKISEMLRLYRILKKSFDYSTRLSKSAKEDEIRRVISEIKNKKPNKVSDNVPIIIHEGIYNTKVDIIDGVIHVSVND
tara:strand:+ start:1919 stop:2152 length:234 start_codon:yes stop_codon:yes gene_type:complete